MTAHRYDFTGRTAVVTGGSGVLCAPICEALAHAGANVVVVAHRNLEKAEALVKRCADAPGRVLAATADVTRKASLRELAERVEGEFGGLHILIHGAGGALKEATTSAERGFAELPEEALRWVLDLNGLGTILASQVFVPLLQRTTNEGAILMFSSRGAVRPLTRSVAYSAGKAAVTNFMQWLAVHLAHEYGPGTRVNALVPGFFLTAQNRFLLTDETTGAMTERGRRIIDHTPLGRFGQPDDLVGPALWLLSDEARFVHGATLTVDGGLDAYGGV